MCVHHTHLQRQSVYKQNYSRISLILYGHFAICFSLSEVNKPLPPLVLIRTPSSIVYTTESFFKMLEEGLSCENEGLYMSKWRSLRPVEMGSHGVGTSGYDIPLCFPMCKNSFFDPEATERECNQSRVALTGNSLKGISENNIEGWRHVGLSGSSIKATSSAPSLSSKRKPAD